MKRRDFLVVWPGVVLGGSSLLAWLAGCGASGRYSFTASQSGTILELSQEQLGVMARQATYTDTDDGQQRQGTLVMEVAGESGDWVFTTTSGGTKRAHLSRHAGQVMVQPGDRVEWIAVECSGNRCSFTA